MLCCIAGFQERNAVDGANTQSRGFKGFRGGFGQGESKFDGLGFFFILSGLYGYSICLVNLPGFACSLTATTEK